MSLNELTWFAVNGFVYDVEQPNDDASSTQPQLLEVSGFVDFFPGTDDSAFPSGFGVLVPDLDHGDGSAGDTLVPLAPITARLMNGAICAIAVGDPKGQQLLANSAILGLDDPLYYHFRWRNVTFGGGVQALSNGAFAAPTGAESIANLVGTPSGSGGTLPAGTTYWGVSAVTSWGETAISNVISETLSGATSSVALSWSAVANALGYNIYRGSAANALTTLVASNHSGTSFTDTGSAGTSGVTAPLIDQLDLTSPLLTITGYHGP